MPAKSARILEIVRALSALVRSGDELTRRLRIMTRSGTVQFSIRGRESGGQILAQDVDLESELDVVVDLPFFEKILSASDSEHVRLDVEGSNLRISLDRAVFSIPLLNPESYVSPPHKDLPIDLRVKTDLSSLRKSLRRVEYVLDSRLQTLPSTVYSSYVVFDFDAATSEFVPFLAIERRRLSVAFLPVRFEKENVGGKIVVLPDSIELPLRVFRSEENEEVAISASRSVAFLEVRDCEAFATVANAFVPNWSELLDRVISQSSFEAKVPARGMRSALRQIAPVVNPEYRRIALVFNPKQITVCAHGESQGEIVVDADCSVTESNRIVLDHRLLLEYVEACHSLSDAEIRIRFGGPREALVFTNGEFTSRKPNEYFHVLMPIAEQ